MPTPDYIRAHRHSSYHREEVLTSEILGCFGCIEIFKPADIKEWIDWYSFTGKNKDAKPNTAICPKCGIDAVIGSECGYPITKEFLLQMHEYWFKNSNRCPIVQ